jgi:hypothetical protein
VATERGQAEGSTVEGILGDLERVRAHELLVASYVSSYDVSSNPTVAEGESMQSVKKNRRTLVEQWWYSSSPPPSTVNPIDTLFG